MISTFLISKLIPKMIPQDAFGGRFENWGLLPREVISDAVLDFNNGRVSRGLWRTYSGARGFIVEKGESCVEYSFAK